MRHVLAEARRREQAFDQFGIGVGRFVGQERGDFPGVWRKTGEVQRDAPDERGLVRRRREGQPSCFSRASRKASSGPALRSDGGAGLTGGSNDQCL